ncbi:MAG: acyl carrier protein [Candidatus Bathyarchaeota archaeon]|nr:acyl carrier protein [Candidatus Termiticorpusculum sp.]
MIDKLQKILLRHTDGEEIIITGETVLLTDLGLHSLKLIDMICEVEEEFKIEIPDRMFGSFVTVQNLLDFIAEYTANKNRGL